MRLLCVLAIWFGLLTYVSTGLITYDQVRGTPYKVGYDHRAVTINGVRTMLISGAIHYPRSTPSKPMPFGIYTNKSKVSLTSVVVLI